jgi:thioredoxin
MRRTITCLLCAIAFLLAACGGGDTAMAPVAAPPEVIDITSTAQFEAEVAKAHAGAVVVADFHAEWCGPCKKLGPELIALAAANPGRLYVLRIDIDQQPDLAARFLVESIPLLVKFTGGKAGERQPGYVGKEALAQWLAIR